jgi:hypothetical protein
MSVERNALDFKEVLGLNVGWATGYSAVFVVFLSPSRIAS